MSVRPGTITTSISTAAAASTPGVPVGLRRAFARTALVCGSVLVALSAAAAGWVLLPGRREVIVRPSFELRVPVSTTARVRHERGFVSNSRLHEFRFDFRDQEGRDRRESASVVGFFGFWSDPRFDYLALARFVRASCTPERAQRFLEFGWSVPCSRDDISIVHDRDNPARFRVVGFEFRPGYLARGMRAVVTALVNLLAILIALAVVALVAASWARLWAIFAGDPEMIPHLLRRGDATERPSGDPA